MSIKIHNSALSDINSALKNISLAGLLGFHDVKQRYIRSKLGPFWLTISMGVMIGTIGVVFGNIFNSPIETFLPFLTLGIIVWTFISTSISEGCQSFISAEHLIKQLPIPLFTHILRNWWRNLIIFAHNLLIVPIVFLFFGIDFSWSYLLAIPGLVLLSVNLLWMSLFLAIICTRFRDLAQIVNSILQVFFYLTPIIWMPSLINNARLDFFLQMNPFYHLLVLVREPLLGGDRALISFTVSLFTAVLGWLFTLVFFSKFRQRIAYWL